MKLMVRSLLEDRFHMRTHSETRELPIYHLVAVKGGSKLKLSDDQSPPVLTPLSNPDRNSTPPRGRSWVAGNRTATGITYTLLGTAVNLSNFANLLQAYVGRPIVATADLKGLFDFRFTFAPESLMASPPGTAAEASQESVFTALQEQLGLKLESARGPVEVLVIDSVQHPTEN